MITDSTHGDARIIDVTPGRIREALDAGHIAIVAGFQGVSQDTKDITTLGRGGSDTTAVALAAALEADVCEIYTDVDGVFTADPRIVPERPQTRPTHLRGDAGDGRLRREGAAPALRRVRPPLRRAAARALVVLRQRRAPGSSTRLDRGEPTPWKHAIITGVAHDRSEAKITVVGVPDQPGMAAGSSGLSPTPRSTSTWSLQNVSARARPG